MKGYCNLSAKRSRTFPSSFTLYWTFDSPLIILLILSPYPFNPFALFHTYPESKIIYLQKYADLPQSCLRHSLCSHTTADISEHFTAFSATLLTEFLKLMLFILNPIRQHIITTHFSQAHCHILAPAPVLSLSICVFNVSD